MAVINIGSKNPGKIEAVREVIVNYDFLNPFTLNSISIDSRVLEQPMSLEEAIKGARNRAINSFVLCNYSIGLESYLLKIPNSNKFIDKCVCEIYDGSNFYTGESEGFIIPEKIMKFILEKGLDLSQATREIGLTNSEKIGNEGGIIGILSYDRFVRGDQTKRALQMALIELENPFYRDCLGEN